MKNYILKNCNIYDGTLNMKLIPNSDIEITNGVITSIGQINKKSGYKVIDLKGKYVVPGLINLHTHLPSSGKLSKKRLGDKEKLRNFVINTKLGNLIGSILVKSSALNSLKSGITTLRAVGGVGTFDSELRDKINSNKIIGPRLVVCNEAIGTPGGHMVGTLTIAVNSKEEAIREVDRLYKEKVDWIKLMITGGVLDGNIEGKPAPLRMPADFVKVCCDEAHKLGLKVCAHVESKEGMHIAIENGVDCIEHGADMENSDITILKEKKGAIVTTFSAALPFVYLDPIETGYGRIAKTNSEIVLNGMINAAKQGLKNNINVGLGTDAGSTLSMHYNFYKELIYFCNFTNVDSNFALHTATEINAKILGINNETGTIQINKSADLLILNKDPILDLESLKDPYIVFIKGNKIKSKIKHNKKADNLLKKIKLSAN